MEITKGKIAALLVAVALVVIAVVRSSALGALQMVLELACPLILILFPDEIGALWGKGINRDTPGVFVSVMGWIFLVAVGIVVFVSKP
jgi:hypothetical protein